MMTEKTLELVCHSTYTWFTLLHSNNFQFSQKLDIHSNGQRETFYRQVRQTDSKRWKIKKRERGNWAKCTITENLLLTTSYFWAISAACSLFPLPGGPKNRIRGVKGAAERGRVWTKARTATGGKSKNLSHFYKK